MKKFICFILITASITSTASPTTTVDNSCTYDFPAAKSALDEKSKDFSKIAKTVRNEKDKFLTQTATFKDGTKVTFMTGGCAHYSYSYTFSNLKQKSFTADQAFKLAIELLKKTPIIKDTPADTKTLTVAANLAGMNKIFRPPNANYEIPCGDAQCNLDASKKGELSIGYSFAL